MYFIKMIICPVFYGEAPPPPGASVFEILEHLLRLVITAWLINLKFI